LMTLSNSLACIRTASAVFVLQTHMQELEWCVEDGPPWTRL
jgi:hypothetical protein